MSFNVKKLRYDIDQVLHHFGLERNKNCPLITDWLDVVVPELLELNFSEENTQCNIFQKVT